MDDMSSTTIVVGGTVTPESRRLPSRKRSRSAAATDCDINLDGDAGCVAVDATAIVEEGGGGGGGIGGGPETPTPLLVMPDLIRELIENGSVAPHIRRLLRGAHSVTWRDRTGIDPEVEVGTTVATLEPVAPKETVAAAAGPGGAPVQAPVPFLLRAFRRTVPADVVGVRTATATAAAPIHHCIAEPQAIDDWAPLSLLHVVKALRACGVSLRGPTVFIQPTETVTATADGQRYVLSRRMRLRLGGSPGVTTSEADLKCKYHVPVTYPGPSQSETLHLALECRRTDGNDGAVLHAARRSGILPARTSVILRAAPVQRNTYAKCEWSSGVDDHALVRVVVRLQFVLPDGASVAAFHAAVLASPRPRGPSDVPRWIEAVGCRGSAEWRIELEMIPPIHTAGLTQVLFLHHLVRQTLQPTGACLSRAAFTGLFARHLRSAAARETTDAAYGRWMLAEYCRDADLPLNARSGYPRQPRPFDLVDRYVDRLLGCVATPKADDPRGTDNDHHRFPAVTGTEAFLVGHAYGATLWLRTGAVRTFRWVPAAGDDGAVTIPTFPFLLEGEMFGDYELFMAYDCVVTPTARYGSQGRYAVRCAATEALLRRLDGRLSPLTVRCKPTFGVERHPHDAIRRCASWSRAVGLPCDGVVFVDDTHPGYNRAERLWKLKDVPTIDFAVFRVGPDLPGVFEIVLRGPKGTLQSLHRFRSDDAEYVAPVLIRPPSATVLRDGQVVELTVRTTPVTSHAPGIVRPPSFRVAYPSLACRETGDRM